MAGWPAPNGHRRAADASGNTSQSKRIARRPAPSRSSPDARRCTSIPSFISVREQAQVHAAIEGRDRDPPQPARG